MNVKTGLDLLFAEQGSRLKGARVAVVANHATVDSRLEHLVDIIHSFGHCTLKRIFAPEHGFRGEQQDMAQIADAMDMRTAVPVTSLYGSSEESLRPKEEHLREVDLLVVDLPDVGTRYYTFAQTLGYCLQVAEKTKTPVVVLDRPNPIGGTEVEGFGLKASCRSFCGYAPVPPRHGMTLGELALLMNDGVSGGGVTDSIPAIGAKLEVIKAEGWERKQYFDETGLPWVPPSPNMPSIETAVVYPGACLIEATTLSEARGTTKPFEFLGAPDIHAFQWRDAIEASGISLSGVNFRPCTFLPQFQKHAGKLCHGLQVHVTDRRSFKPLRTYLALLFALKRVQPEALRWRKEVYEFISKVPAMDLLYGSSRLRDALDANTPPGPILAEMETYEEGFRSWRKPFLLYV